MDKKNSTRFVMFFIAILFAISALLTWIMIGNYNKDSSKERSILTQAHKKAKDKVFIYDQKRGQEVYNQFCLRCHASQGQGSMSAPPLKGSEFVTGNSEKLVALVTKGMNGEIKREGKVYNLSMPGFNMITHKDLAHVLSYIRNSFGNEASVITEIEVIEAKVKFVERDKPWTEAELKN